MKGEKDDTSVDCREALHRVYHFLDGELTPERRDQIAHHLDECSPCVEVFGFETEIRRLVADRCRDQVPEELRTRIAAAIDHEHQARSRTGGTDEGVEL
jgi:mycothiol system anti-sigma-R factor